MRLTFHGTLLGVIMLLLAMMALGPARQLWNEQQRIRSDTQAIAAGNAEATRLTGRIEAMQDPKHVEQLARDQLGYVRPGETSYIIVHPQQPAAPPSPPAAKTTSWLRLTWTGIRYGL
ncbi:MAG TPA: septum formation initiator family protein [Actinomycetota bacterium]|nr:septum formation initiator family protein [Actinomycetota bacterium]